MTQNLTSSNQVSSDRLASDLKRVVSDTESLLNATANQLGPEVADLRTKIQGTLSQAKQSLADAQSAMVDRAKEVGRATDDFVHDHPWKAVGAAVGLGLVIGLLISRR